MLPSAGDELVVKPEGFLVAILSFLLTRGLLIDVLIGNAGEPLFMTAARFVPLGLGLGMVVFGVSLAVSTRERRYVRTVAVWYLLGSLWMLVLVGAAAFESVDMVAELRRSGVVSTAVVGGGAGGILVGIRSANNRKQQESLDRQAEQSTLLNRLLRHEVLNALTAIRGHAGLLADGSNTERSAAAVEENVERIEQTIDDVGFIVRTVGETRDALGSIDLGRVLDTCRDQFAEDDGSVTVDGVDSVEVRADDNLETVIAQLVATARERTPGAEVTIDLAADETTASLRISAPGNWLSDSERAVLLDGLPEYDNPDVEFPISTTRLLVAQYDGTIDVTESGATTTVTVELLRVGNEAMSSGSPGVDAASLRNAAIAGLGSGAVMGLALQAFSGQIAVIGGLYGVQTLAIGWITHLFHSVVFATLFAAICARYRLDDSRTIGETTALAVGYALVLWLVAAGIVMGLWLNAVGIPADIPNLGTVSLIGHLLWGATLGLLYGALSGDA